jgi:hypothetical protein
MQTAVTYFGALLVAVLALALPALANRQHWRLISEAWRTPLRLALGLLQEELGVSVLYTSNIPLPPGSAVTAFTSGATAPTVAQVTGSQVPAQQAQIFWADSDATGQVITHNWGAAGLLNSTQAINLQVWHIKLLGGGSDSSFATQFTYGLTNTNSITMTKIGNGTGSGGTYNVYMRLPYSQSF